MNLDVHLSAIAAGDADAFARWLAASEMRIRLSLKSYAAQVDVESVVQETMLRVWQVAPRFEPDGEINSLLRFAVRVARNTAVSEMRRLGAVRPAGEPALEIPVEPAEPDPMLRARIAECREELPARPGQALDARLASSGGEPDLALATALQMTLNTYLQNVTRARKLLAECLEKKGVAIEVVP